MQSPSGRWALVGPNVSVDEQQRARENVVVEWLDGAELPAVEVLGLEHDVRVELPAQAARGAQLIRDVGALGPATDEGIAIVHSRQDPEPGVGLPVELD